MITKTFKVLFFFQIIKILMPVSLTNRSGRLLKSKTKVFWFYKLGTLTFYSYNNFKMLQASELL